MKLNITKKWPFLKKGSKGTKLGLVSQLSCEHSWSVRTKDRRDCGEGMNEECLPSFCLCFDFTRVERWQGPPTLRSNRDLLPYYMELTAACQRLERREDERSKGKDGDLRWARSSHYGDFMAEWHHRWLMRLTSIDTHIKASYGGSERWAECKRGDRMMNVGEGKTCCLLGQQSVHCCSSLADYRVT